MRRPTIRFSLRSLLIAMTILPAAAYWLGLPTLHAHRFAHALASGNYEAADRLCVDQKNPYPGDMKTWLSFKASARIEKATWADLSNGRRRMKYYWQAHMGSTIMSFLGRECVATRRGIEFPAEKEQPN
jgi:hypothetical protein